MQPTVRIQRDDFDLGAETERLTGGRADVGAVVSFTGLCRDESGRLAALEHEHNPGMAEAEIRRIAAEACTRWPLTGLTVIHRFGLMRPGDRIVAVLAASSHRQAAFEAASFVMDFLKTQAPFWKREHPASGEPGGWVDARDEDDASAERWR